MSTILFSPKNAISAGDKAKLDKEGYIVIEVEDASQIKTISDLPLVSTNILAMAAMKCMRQNNMSNLFKEMFTNEVLDAVLNKAITKPSK